MVSDFKFILTILDEDGNVDEELELYNCYEAFSKGENIESITMGNSIKSIASSGFSSCWLLTSLTIGSGVTSIGDYVFKNCNNLDLIHYQGTKEQWYAIKKGENWNTNWSSYKWEKTIQCTDGNITYR